MRIKIGSKYYIHSNESNLTQEAIRNRVFYAKKTGKDLKGYVKLPGGWYVEEKLAKQSSDEGRRENE